VIELGCGPYTQLQSMLRPKSTALSITLVDPLAALYLERTKGCTYKDHRLLDRPVRVLSQPAEALTFAHVADTIVMVSILQSVQDVPRVLQAAYNALKPGGWLVFSDRVFDARWEAHRAGASPFWDVGHPCAVKQTVIDHFLSGFEEVYTRRWTKQDPKGSKVRRQPDALQDEQLYFIGRKSLEPPTRLFGMGG